jgi:hypothetical protein
VGTWELKVSGEAEAPDELEVSSAGATRLETGGYRGLEADRRQWLGWRPAAAGLT